MLLPASKQLALLVYLRSIPKCTATRDHIVELLWADSDVARGRQSLRQILSRLRQLLGEGAITAQQDRLTLTLPLWHDREAFLDAITGGDLGSACELYHGPFLPEFASPGAVRFEHWAETERQHLKVLFLRAGESLARDYLEEDPRAALRLTRRLRLEDSESESVWRLLLRAALAIPDLVQAAAETEAFERMARETGRAPEPATAELLGLARERGSATECNAVPLGLITELVGREKEFAVLTEAWQQAARGGSQVRHVEARAGIGKSRMLHDFAFRLRALGAQVVELRANPGEQLVGDCLVADAVRALTVLPGVAGIRPESAGPLIGLAPGLATRFPSAGPPPTGDLPYQRGLALADLLAALAEERPTAVLVDDLHWSDTSSRATLVVAANRLGPARVLLVTAARPGEGGGPLRPDSAVIRLEPLSAEGCEALVAGTAIAHDPDWAARLGPAIWRVSGGSPLLAIEALHLALERGDLRVEEGVWMTDDLDAAIARIAEGDPLTARILALPAEERRVLLLLSLAGTPLPGTMLSREGPAADAPDPVLTSLEVGGHIGRTGSGWIVGHDEIGATMLRLAPEDEQQSAASALGRGFLADAGANGTQLGRAARLFAVAGDQKGLATALHRGVLFARKADDARSSVALVAELLHQPQDDPAVRALARALPLGVRLRHRRTLALAALGAVALLAALIGTPRVPPLPPPDVELLLLDTMVGGRAEFTTLPLRLAAWDPTRPVDLSAGNPVTVNVGERFYGDLAVAPDRNRIALTWLVADSGLTDIYLREKDGTTRRLTFSRGDDVHPSWSPDGRYLAWSTTRWSPGGNADADIGILDPTTGTVRQLTRGPDSDLQAVWSPDGSRIAYMRLRDQDGRPEVCWVTVDGESGHCLDDPDTEYSALLGWDHQDRILTQMALTSSASDGMLVALDPENSGRVVVDSGPFTGAKVSGDGGWLLATQVREGEVSFKLSPVGRPDLARDLAPTRYSAGLMGAAWHSRTAPRFLDTLRLIPPVAPPVVGLSHQLGIHAVTGGGRHLRFSESVLRWRVNDSTIATIAPTGLLHPLREGVVQVYVTAGGWRSDSMRLRVQAGDIRLVDSVTWAPEEWEGFGTPLPMLDSSQPGARVLLINGDETFESGAVAVHRYPVREGLSVDALVAMPVGTPKWQDLKMVLVRDVALTADGASGEASCVIAYPAGEGRRNLDLLLAAGAGSGISYPGFAHLGDGGWHRFRIEVLPDGSCNFSVNGRPVGRSRPNFAAADSVQISFSGHSVGTKIRVGKVEIWRGVRTVGAGE